VEASNSSPTAGVLGRMCGGLGIPMSALMAAVETEDERRRLAEYLVIVERTGR
jgi:hypothetical protein